MGLGEAGAAVAKRVGLFRVVTGYLRGPAKTMAADAARSGARVMRQPLQTGLRQVRRSKEFARRVLTRDPIDVATGEVVLRQVDVELDAVLPMVVERTHLSSYPSGRLFGRSWASSLDQRLEIDADGVRLMAEDGMVLDFPVPAPGRTVQPENGPLRSLSLTPEGAYTVSDAVTGRTLHFGGGHAGTANGHILPISAVTDLKGNRLDFDYDDTGTLYALRHSGGYRIGVHVADGRARSLRLVTAGNGAHADIELVRYGYDEAGRLTEVTDSSGEAQRFSYDGHGRLTGWLDRNGQSYRYEYDEQGRGVRGRGSGGFLDATLAYDTEQQVTTVTDSLGHSTAYRLNDLGQLVAEVDPLGNETRREWDHRDRLLAETDPLGNTTRYEYDGAGNLTTIVRPDGHKVVAAYNDLGLPVRVVLADGQIWRYEYDDRGNMVLAADPLGAVTRYTYDDHGAMASFTDALGDVTRIRSNPAGLPVEVIAPDGATSRYERDAFGRVVTATDAAGGSTRLRWTVEGRLVERILPSGATERWTYDAEGNEVEYVDASGRVTRTEYTNFDAPTARTVSDGRRLEFSLDTELRVTAVTDPAGMTWRYEYDAAGRIVRETDFNGRAVSYTHDAAGRLAERVNGAGQVTRYTRDRLGHVVRRDAGGQVTTLTRDPAGRVVRAVGADTDLRLERDALGRVVAEIRDGHTLSNVFDALGRRVVRRTPSGAESAWAYDPMHRPVALRTGGQTLRFGYDRAGREIRRHIGDGAILDQAWDTDHRLVSQTLWGAPSAPGRVTAGAPAADPGGARLLQHRAYRYRLDGHVTAIADRLSGERRFELDSAGRITAAVHSRGWTERYAYDAAGNVTAADWPTSGPGPLPPADDAGERVHTGTLIRRAGATHYEYDGQGRVVTRRRRTLSGKVLTWHYTWNAEDRLVSATTPAGRWRYRYDALGRRIAKERLSADGHAVVERIDFTWDGTVPAEQVHSAPGADGRVTSRVTTWNHQPGSFRPLTQTERMPARDAPQEWIDARFQAIVGDLTGSPAEMVDPAGEVTWQRSATVWGLSYSGIGADDACPFRFPGQYHDAETGLDYNYHRYYEPATARYQTPDPLGLTPQPNPHAYTRNPVTLVDPLGLSPYPASDEPLKLYRSPGLGNRASERRGLSVDNHEGSHPTAYLANKPEGAAQYAGNGHDPGFHVFTMKPGFREAFGDREFPLPNKDGVEGLKEWRIPSHRFDEFNSYIDHDKTEWWDSMRGWFFPPS